MAPSIPPSSSPEKPHHGFPFAPLSAARSIQSLAAGVLSRLPFGPHNPAVSSYKSTAPPSSSAVALPAPVLFPFNSSYSSGPILSGYHQVSGSAASAARRLPSSVRIDGLGPGPKGGGDGGPAFVGQVFSMLDPSGNGLMAVTTHWHIPFLSKRTPGWFKKMLAAVTKSDRNGPVFRFFMDLSDAVAYVKRLNIPTGMVGACRLDVAYEHFKEKPHMFQFVPNEKQVKAANKLLKTIPRKSGRRKLNGVPVFTAQNLNIAIATNDGIKWYTPYFFDKSLLDNILEASIDQHFHTLIQNRHMQRRRDVIDDNLTAEIVEENGESFFEPPEVQEVLDEMGHPGVPLSVISKAAEIQLLDVIDKVLLGNKWLRKATGIQPKFPYVVDSFEQRSAASLQKTAVSLSSAPDLDTVDDKLPQLQLGATEVKLNDTAQGEQGQLTDHTDFRFPFGDWFLNPWSHLHGKHQKPDDQDADTRSSRLTRDGIKQAPSNPLLPKITMVGISMGEGGQMSKASLKKTMDELTKELESNQGSSKFNEDRDPLFVANVGDYSGIMRMNSA